MNDKAQKIFTTVLTNTTFVIKAEYGVTLVEIKLISGVGTYKGNRGMGGIDSTANSLVVDKPVTITSDVSKYIDEVTIDVSAGSVEVIAR